MAMLWTVGLIMIFEHRTNDLKSEVARMSDLQAEVAILKDQLTTVHSTMQSREAETRHDSLSHEYENSPPPLQHRPRRLGAGFYKVGTNGVGLGCISFGATETYDMSATACTEGNTATSSGGKMCPPCFIFTGGSSDSTINIDKCSTSRYKQGSGTGDGHQLHSNGPQVAEFMFINADTSNALTVKARTSVPAVVTTFYVPPASSVTAFCYVSGGDRLYPAGPSYGTGFCPEGCDAAQPSHLSSAAAGATFTNGLVTASKVATLNNLGTAGPSATGGITQAEWDLLDGMTCSASAASATDSDIAVSAAGTQDGVCHTPIGNANAACPNQVDNVLTGSLSVVSSSDVSTICTSTR